MNKTRCSSLPLAWKCAESQEPQPGAVIVDQSDEAADMGTAVHRLMASHVSGDPIEIRTIASEYDVEQDELSVLFNCGRQIWKEIGEHFPGDRFVERYSEHDIGGLTLCGTEDVAAINGNVLIVNDWKSGRLDTDYTHQVRGYGLLGLLDFESEETPIDEVICITSWLRDGKIDIDRMTKRSLIDWSVDLQRRLINGRGKFNPGSHCQYCQRRMTCPGRAQLVKTVMQDLSIEGKNLMEWTPETRNALAPQIGEAYSRIKLIEKACESFREQVKIDIAANGPLLTGDGRCLRLDDTNRRTMNAGKAMAVLDDYLDPPDILACTSISISQCEKRLAAKSAPGEAKKKIEQMSRKLTEAGALHVTTSKTLREGKAST